MRDFNIDRFGVEVEVEFQKSFLFPDGISIEDVTEMFENMQEVGELANWKCENDGSLRHGLEFVMRRPQSYEKTIQHVNELYSWFDAAELPLQFSFRTSTHIHADVRHLNTAQMFALIMLWGVYEYDHMEILDGRRLNNRFCLTDYITPNNNSFKLSCLTSPIQMRRAREYGERYRYTALNVCDPMLHQGSVEFRSMQGNDDIKKFEEWLKRISTILNIAKRYDSPVSMYRIWNALKNKPALFKKLVFGCYPNHPVNMMLVDAAEADIVGDMDHVDFDEIPLTVVTVQDL